MASIPIEIDDHYVEQLHERARQEGVSPEEYLKHLVERELTPRAERLKRATQKVLEANHELYERLS